MIAPFKQTLHWWVICVWTHSIHCHFENANLKFLNDLWSMGVKKGDPAFRMNKKNLGREFTFSRYSHCSLVSSPSLYIFFSFQVQESAMLGTLKSTVTISKGFKAQKSLERNLFSEQSHQVWKWNQAFAPFFPAPTWRREVSVSPCMAQTSLQHAEGEEGNKNTN